MVVDWLMLLAGLILGILIGIGFFYLFSKNGRREAALKRDFNKVKQDYHAYQEQVGEHLSKTAQMVSQMNRGYQAIYDHVVDGASDLNKGSYKQSFLQPNAHYFEGVPQGALDSSIDINAAEDESQRKSAKQDADKVAAPKDYAEA